MQLPETFRWQGVGQTYSLPWIRNRVELTGDPSRIADYARKDFTRSRMLMNLLQQFHLSSDSILVSSDEHSALLRGILVRKFPAAGDYPEIARDLIGRIFVPQVEGEMHIAGICVRSMYATLLQSILGVRILPPLQAYIDKTDFSPGWRPLRLEALMYSLGLHSPIFAPVRIALDSLFFREARRMRKISKELEKLVYTFSMPEPGSWFESLETMRIERKISRAQFRGEITAILVSSFSLASTLTFCLLCLGARPRYIEKIRSDPGFAKHFLSEVLRLYPPFHQFGYQRDAHARVPGDDGATDFLVSAYYLHRNRDAWSHADQFWPERFLVETERNRYRYLPFGLGARICPGRSYSLRLLAEVLKFVCSDASPVTFPQSEGLPTGRSDRVISFPVDDRLTFSLRTH